MQYLLFVVLLDFLYEFIIVSIVYTAGRQFLYEYKCFKASLNSVVVDLSCWSKLRFVLLCVLIASLKLNFDIDFSSNGFLYDDNYFSND